MTDAQALGNLPQAGSARRKEAAQQSPAALSFFPATRHSSPATTSGSALGELLQPPPPALRAAPQPIKDPRELARNRGLAVAEKPAGVIDQEPIASQ